VDTRKRINIDDVKAFYQRCQKAAVEGREFDIAGETVRMGRDAELLRNALKHAALPVIRKNEFDVPCAEWPRSAKEIAAEKVKEELKRLEEKQAQAITKEEDQGSQDEKLPEREGEAK